MSKSKSKYECPLLPQLLAPVFEVIKSKGGSATNSEIAEAVATMLNLSEKQLDETCAANPSIKKFNYELGWARTYLSKVGLISNSAHGVWTIDEE